MTCSNDGTVRVWDVRKEGKKPRVRFDEFTSNENILLIVHFFTTHVFRGRLFGMSAICVVTFQLHVKVPCTLLLRAGILFKFLGNICEKAMT